MTQRASESLVAVLIRIGLLLALAVLLMAENAQARQLSTSSWTHGARTIVPTSRQPHHHHAAGARIDGKT